jgi:uncharacterized membrane protein YfcA
MLGMTDNTCMELIQETRMDLALLALATFIASSVQSAIGFGFGLVAVSTFLVVMNSVSAVQLVIIITLVITIPHWFLLKNTAPKQLLIGLSIGCIFGFPLGIIAYQQLSLELIKAVVALLIILVSLQTIWQTIQVKSKQVHKFHLGKTTGVGVVSGLMASSLAMPGPAVMIYLSRTTLSKDEIRSIILSFFLFSYGGALFLQATLVGITNQTWTTAVVLTPPALVGMVVGHLLSNKINQKLFKSLVLIVLMLTGIFMLFNL